MLVNDRLFSKAPSGQGIPLRTTLYNKLRFPSYSGDMHPPKKQICLYFMT